MAEASYTQASDFTLKYKVASMLDGLLPAYYSGIGAQAAFVYGEENANLYDTMEDAQAIIIGLRLGGCWVQAPPPAPIYALDPPPEEL